MVCHIKVNGKGCVLLIILKVSIHAELQIEAVLKGMLCFVQPKKFNKVVCSIYGFKVDEKIELKAEKIV
ncbi:hypothetical protein [Fervidicola ferrireducens]|uniref:hypothetical protein n=1 Tax=Fervidicola ferrireducens TaxID=520764 RepID=UPI0012ED3D29|nr:hypothetical protein [Fervidicola ferrireducens]